MDNGPVEDFFHLKNVYNISDIDDMIKLVESALSGELMEKEWEFSVDFDDKELKVLKQYLKDLKYIKKFAIRAKLFS